MGHTDQAAISELAASISQRVEYSLAEVSSRVFHLNIFLLIF